MKRTIITSMVAILIAANGYAQTDTLTVSQPKEVKVVTNGDTLNISIEGSKDNPRYFYNKTVVTDHSQEEVTTTSKNVGSGLGWDFSLLEGRNTAPRMEVSLRPQIYAGWNFLLNNPSDMKLDWAKSIEAGFDIFHIAFYPRTDKWWLSLDWGILASTYQFKHNMMTTASDGTIIMAPYPDGSSSQSSSFRTLSSNLTLMGHYRLAKEHSIGLGLVLNSKTIDNCSYKTKYALPDGTAITDMNELPVHSNILAIKAEYMFADRFGIYLRYTPMSIFKKGNAPDFRELSAGFQVRF